MEQQSNKIKTSLHLDKHQRKGDGKSQFKLRVYVGEKKYIYIRTGKFMDQKYWVDKTIKSGKGNPNASKLKAATGKLVAKCESVVNDLIENKKTVTKKAIERLLFAPPPSKSKYKTYLDFMMACHQRDIDTDTIRATTIRRELTVMKALRAYDNETPIQDIDLDWLENYKIHMIQVKQYAVASMAVHFKILKKTMGKALAQRLIDFDPFLQFTYERGDIGKRNFLALSELNHLHELYVTGHFLTKVDGGKRKRDALHQVCQLFLASCYTGLRFGDVTRLDRSWFHGDVIRATLNKSRGRKTVTIPVSGRLLEVLSENGNQVFLRKPVTNTRANIVLKEIMEIAGINKHISFHCSRHTFACVGLEIGISTEIIQQVLGHSNIKETQIYARIQGGDVKRAMKAWDNIPHPSKQRPVKLQKVG